MRCRRLLVDIQVVLLQLTSTISNEIAKTMPGHCHSVRFPDQRDFRTSGRCWSTREVGILCGLFYSSSSPCRPPYVFPCFTWSKSFELVTSRKPVFYAKPSFMLSIHLHFLFSCPSRPRHNPPPSLFYLHILVLLSLRVRTDLTYFLVYFSDFRCPSNSYPSKYPCFRHIQHVILCCRHVTSFSSLSYSRKCYILEEHEHCKDILSG